MNKIIIPLSIMVLAIFSSCAKVPDGVKTKNRSESVAFEEKETENFETIENAVADSDKIYENDYGQIKIKPGLDLDFGNVSEVMEYSVSNVEWDEEDFEKVLDFFKSEGLFGETESTDSGTAFDGEWVEFSDGKSDITMDYFGFAAYSANIYSPDSVICDSFKYGDEKCDKKYKLKNGEYSFNEVNEYVNGLIEDWEALDGMLSYVPAEIFVWEDENGINSFDIFYAKQANGIKFNYELSSTLNDDASYIYLNVCVDSYGEISFWSTNNGIFELEKSSKVEGPFISLDDALKTVQKKFTPHTDFNVSEIMLSYEMVYDEDDDVYKTKPCWKFNFDDNSEKDDYTHKMVRNVYVDITSGELFDSYGEQASW